MRALTIILLNLALCKSLFRLKTCFCIVCCNIRKSDEEYISKAVNIQAYTFLLKPFNPMNLKLAIIMCINQTKRSDKVELGNGVYFDEYRDQFFKKGGVMIDFTRLEKGFLKLLIEKRDEITTPESPWYCLALNERKAMGRKERSP